MVINNKKVVVLLGGISAEKEVSLESGLTVYKALKAANINVEKYEVTANLMALLNYLIENRGQIIVFNALHGTFGEDGTLQAILDTLEIPYTHSGRLASTIAMNKSLTKKIVSACGIAVPKEQILKVKDLVAKREIDFPLVVKPISEGSSIGVYIVNNLKELKKLQKSYNNPTEKLMVEEYIEGREFTVGVLEGKALTVTDILAVKGNFYDYDSKYSAGGSNHIIPANIDKDVFQHMLVASETVFNALNCRGVARVDFRGDAENIYFLEINTHPGFTGVSLVPEQGEYHNIPFVKMCLMLLQTAKYGA